MKFRMYQHAGVREYWIIDPKRLKVKTCVLEDGKYKVTDYDNNAVIPVAVLEGCEIDIKEAFAE